jgi:hypothetical protein
MGRNLLRGTGFGPNAGQARAQWPGPARDGPRGEAGHPPPGGRIRLRGHIAHTTTLGRTLSAHMR